MTRARAARGLTLIEILVAVVGDDDDDRVGVDQLPHDRAEHEVRGAAAGPLRDQVRNSLSRMAAELSMTYLSFNRPADEERHFTLFDGRDQFTATASPSRRSPTSACARTPTRATSR
jgi:hypothetical protein